MNYALLKLTGFSGLGSPKLCEVHPVESSGQIDHLESSGALRHLGKWKRWNQFSKLGTWVSARGAGFLTSNRC